MKPYYADEWVTLYCGRMEQVLVEQHPWADAIVTDPPYGETSLAWDRWPEGWPALVAEHTNSMWCFGSMRMFLEHRDEFSECYLRDERGRFRKRGSGDWKLSHDSVGAYQVDTAVWEKGNGSGPATDRLRRVHELAAHFYQGRWSDIYHEVPRVDATAEQMARNGGALRKKTRKGLVHQGTYRTDGGWTETGSRLTRSVIYAKSMRGRAIHPTEKPHEILAPLIEYAVPPGGVVLDPFAGSCSTLLTARSLGRKAIGIEADEAMCERAVRERLSVPDLFGGVS